MKIKNYLFGFIAICAVGFSVPAIAYHSYWHAKEDFENTVKMAEQGDAEAQRYLGLMYELGSSENGIAKSLKTAVQWYRKSAEQGNANGQTLLGYMYKDGLGVSQDHKTAVQWFRKAAEQGEATAQNSLGTMYGRGLGVSQDHKTAVQWFRKSAEQGNVYGQYWLGDAYDYGKGVPKDYVRAYMWFLLASLNDGDTFRKGSVADHMTSTEIEKGKNLAHTCLNSNYQDC